MDRATWENLIQDIEREESEIRAGSQGAPRDPMAAASSPRERSSRRIYVGHELYPRPRVYSRGESSRVAAHRKINLAGSPGRLSIHRYYAISFGVTP